MTTEHRVAIAEDRTVALSELETRFAMAVRQRELLENYIKERLTPNKHFYTMGDDKERKPSLTKEGAELICLPHALKGRYHWLSGPENPPLDDAPYQITMKCELEANGKFAGEGVGSASSMITKKDGERIQRQKDPGLRHNAVIKMACKSAYIAATLNSTAASEFFTQDLEDDQTGEFKKQPDKKEHWCEKHHTKFFKTEKMPAYAHPVKNPDGSPTLGDNGKPLWCSEHKEPVPVPKEQPKAKTQADQDIEALFDDGKPTEPAPEKQPETPQDAVTPENTGIEGKDKGNIPKRDLATIKTITDMYKSCHTDFGLQPKDVLAELKITAWSELSILPAEAYTLIASKREGK